MPEMTAQEIKKAIIEKSVKKPEPVEPAEILGIKGFLFKSSSAEMEDWRRVRNNEDPMKSRLAPAKIVQISFRDAGGVHVFEDLDVTILGGIDEEQIFPVAQRCLQINGFGVEAAETIAKNLLKMIGIGGVYDLLASIGSPCPSCSARMSHGNSESNITAKSTGPSETQPKSGERS